MQESRGPRGKQSNKCKQARVRIHQARVGWAAGNAAAGVQNTMSTVLRVPVHTIYLSPFALPVQL